MLVTDNPDDYWQIHRNARLGVSHSQGDVYTHSAMQVCVTGKQLEYVLRRTKNASLDVTINVLVYIPRISSPLLTRFKGMLFNDNVAPRIARLALDSAAYVGAVPPHSEDLSTSLRRPQNLVSLSIIRFTSVSGRVDAGARLGRLLMSAKGLRSLFVVDAVAPLCLQAHVWPNSEYGGVIRNLQQLRIGHGGILGDMFTGVMPIPEVIIEEAVRAEWADEMGTWTVSTSPWPYRSCRVINFTRVTHMHLILDDLSLLSQLAFPVLEYLRIAQSSEGRPQAIADINFLFIPQFAVNLPKLRTLRLMAHDFAPLNRFRVPLLTSLHLTSSHAIQDEIDGAFSALFPSFPLPMEASAERLESSPRLPFVSPLTSIRDLYINSNVSEKLLVQALQSLPFIQSLTLVPGSVLD